MKIMNIKFLWCLLLSIFLPTIDSFGATAPSNDIFQIETLGENFAIPWGFEFFKNNGFLINEKSGNILFYNSKTKEKRVLKGNPPVMDRGQGGLR